MGKMPAKRPAGNLQSMTVATLKAIAKKRGLKGYTQLRKAQLVQLLSGKQSAPAPIKRSRITKPVPPIKQPRRLAKRTVKRKDLAMVEPPCPVVQTKMNIEQFLSQSAYTPARLGIFNGVRDLIYPYPVGSDKDRKFLSNDYDWVNNPVHEVNWWPEFIREIVTHEKIRDLCSLDPAGRPIAIDVMSANDQLFYQQGRTIHVVAENMLSNVAVANRVSPEMLVDMISKGELGQLIPAFNVKLWTLRWGAEAAQHNCGTDKPWLPVLLSIKTGYDEAHRTMLLINTSTRVAYYFDPNGSSRFAQSMASFAVPAIKRFLYERKFFNDGDQLQQVFMVASPEAIGPQAVQHSGTLLGGDDGTCATWTQLFYHLFILNPHLTPQEVLDEMLDTLGPVPLTIVIGRYSMWLAKWASRAFRKKAK
jgi:hypothetical protein